ncbi:hypothetical protein REH65_11715 [Saccharopolyspora sp. ID03-671]|uniref:hypothetical protein n=1 Tax=Saccharopolyspora sp. ID03-671 TaxID=3073066 RepID=UPI003244997A
MSRRTLSLLGSLAAAGALALPLTLPAHADDAEVHFSNDLGANEEHSLDEGCIPVSPTFNQVSNGSGDPLGVFLGGNCSGDPVKEVMPGEQQTLEPNPIGYSVRALE